MAHMVFCVRYKKEMEGLDEPPFDSEFGQKIYKNVSKAAWGEWVDRQKMLLNEYRLQPWTPQAQQFLVEQMEQFFFGEGSALPQEYVPPSHIAANRAAAWHSAICRRRLRRCKLNQDPRGRLTASRLALCRDVAQPGRALAWGARGRQFKSARPDHYNLRIIIDLQAPLRGCILFGQATSHLTKGRSFLSVEADPRSFQFLPGRASLVHNAASSTTGKPSQLRKQLESPAMADRGRLRL